MQAERACTLPRANGGLPHLAEGARAAEALAIEHEVITAILGPAAGGAGGQGSVRARLDRVGCSSQHDRLMHSISVGQVDAEPAAVPL